jgi:hypothetical protein
MFYILRDPMQTRTVPNFSNTFAARITNLYLDVESCLPAGAAWISAAFIGMSAKIGFELAVPTSRKGEFRI